MSYPVGQKGQVVIAKAIRDRLGVEPGWQTVQIPDEDHVRIYFIPPPHRRSLRGCLATDVIRRVTTEGEWDAARRTAWDEASRGEFGRREDD